MMEKTGMTVADLDEEKLAKLRAAERALGVTLVALEPEYSLARLSDEQLKHVQELEKELGVIALAYKRS
jgi:hypothetical protein